MNLPSKPGADTGVVKRPGRDVARSERELPGELRAEETRLEVHAAQPSGNRQAMAALAQLVVAGLVIFAGVLIWQAIVASSPTAERSARERVARLVDVAQAAPATKGPVIEAWGEVQAAQTLIVRPEIAGTLEWIHPEVTAGGRLGAGTVAARFDARDLVLAIRQAEADIAEIEARMELERGQAALGERELTRLSRNITDAQRNLVLRKPQMAQLEAELASARALLAQRLNQMERAEVKVPFDALVVSENVAPGAMLSQGAEAATLVAADRFHVVLAVPGSVLGWIDVEGGQIVRLTQEGIWPEGAAREGRIIRRGSTVSETGRMVELIVAVDDPLATQQAAGQPPLLLGSFVEASIEGAQIEGAVALNRAWLREEDTVWVMTPEDVLEIREVEVLWRGPERVLIGTGLAAGERVVTTTLSSFAAGMALRTRETEVSG